MSFWHEKLRIGTLEVPRFIGGPVDGISDSPFRQIIRQYCTESLLFSEITHANYLAHARKNVKALEFCQSERPLIFQLAANGTDNLQTACRLVLEAGVDAIDLNIACPARNVIGSGSGSALMADPERLKEILTTLRTLVPVPLTVKMRAGFKRKNALDIARLVYECGVDAIFIHPRLQTQKHRGVMDYELVREIKQVVPIPVILSGGIVDWDSAQAAHKAAGADGYLVSRGMIGQPWKLRELNQQSQGKEFQLKVTHKQASALAHLDKMTKYYGEHGVPAFRKHVPYYLTGVEGACSARKEIMETFCPQKVATILKQFIRP